MSTPFTAQATLNLPGTPGLAADPISFLMSSQYDSKAEFEYNLPAGSGTKVVDFGTMPAAGAKLVLVHYEPANAAPPVNVTINAGDQALELSSGGTLSFFSPVPTAGITSMSLAYTGAGRVRVWLLG